jgi:hypothetical protein
MSYALSWYIPNRIVLFTLSDEMTDADVEHSTQELCTQYLDVGDAPVHILYDAHKLRGYPRNLSGLRRNSERYISHPKVGWLLLYGPNNPILLFFATTISQILRVKFRSVPSQAEALKVLVRMDPSLEELVSS